MQKPALADRCSKFLHKNSRRWWRGRSTGLHGTSARARGVQASRDTLASVDGRFWRSFEGDRRLVVRGFIRPPGRRRLCTPRRNTARRRSIFPAESTERAIGQNLDEAAGRQSDEARTLANTELPWVDEICHTATPARTKPAIPSALREMASNRRGRLSNRCTSRPRNRIDRTATVDSVSATPAIIVTAKRRPATGTPLGDREGRDEQRQWARDQAGHETDGLALALLIVAQRPPYHPKTNQPEQPTTDIFKQRRTADAAERDRDKRQRERRNHHRDGHVGDGERS